MADYAYHSKAAKGFHFEGLDLWTAQLKKLATPSVYKDVIGRVVYAGAGVVADAVRSAVNALPTTTSQHGTPQNKINGCTAVQKKGLLDGLGITPMSDKYGVDYWHVKIGFDGYNGQKTEKYPQGQPNSMIARSIESGTSFRSKHPFVMPAANKSKKAAEAAMVKKFDDEMKKLVEE